MSRVKNVVKPKLDFWKIDADKYYCEKADLEKAIIGSGREVNELKRLMGAGFSLLGSALIGERIDQYEVQLIEYAIMPVEAEPSQTWRITDEQLYGKK